MTGLDSPNNISKSDEKVDLGPVARFFRSGNFCIQVACFDFRSRFSPETRSWVGNCHRAKEFLSILLGLQNPADTTKAVSETPSYVLKDWQVTQTQLQ